MMYHASQTPNHGQNPSGINVNVDDVVRSFGNLGFSTDVTFRQRATAFETNNISLSRHSVADHDRIFGFPNFTAFGENYSSDVHNRRQENLGVSIDYGNWYSNSQNFGVGTSAGQTRMNSFYHRPPRAPNFVNSNPFLCPDIRFRPTGQYPGFFSDNSRWYQEELGPRSGLKWLEDILKWGDYEQKQRVISVLKDHIFPLMREKQTSFLFPYFVDACDEEQLNSIFGAVLSESDFFIDLALCEPGANSIIKLIQKMKKSHDHAFTMTHILSTRFLDIMTHRIARKVIKQCLVFFGTQTNKILHEKAIDHFKYLAIHQVGCISLNDCINTISGEQRDTLLNKIAEVSDYLSNDPFGNFVVQNVLALRDIRVTAKMLKCLKGQFVYLSQKKGGSHVVERCMESSGLGLKNVVEEILETPKAPLLLAQDQFGNYIIQKALKWTKESHEFRDLHYSLVKCLEPYCRGLNRTKGGRNIIHLLQ